MRIGNLGLEYAPRASKRKRTCPSLPSIEIQIPLKDHRPSIPLDKSNLKSNCPSVSTPIHDNLSSDSETLPSTPEADEALSSCLGFLDDDTWSTIVAVCDGDLVERWMNDEK